MSPCLHVAPGVFVCTVKPETRRRVLFCPTCEQRRRMRLDVYDWYPAVWTCCHCGDSWSEDGRQPRPFRPGWRREATTYAKKAWQ